MLLTRLSPPARANLAFPTFRLACIPFPPPPPALKHLKLQKVQVSAGTTYSLPMKLAVASQATTVEVNAAGVALDTTSTTQTTVLPTRTIQDTPMNGRDFTQFMQLTPGFAGYSAGGGAGIASVNGTRSNSVNWQIEGTDNNDLVVEYSGRQSRRCEWNRRHRVAARCDRSVFLRDQFQSGNRAQSRWHCEPGDQVRYESVPRHSLLLQPERGLGRQYPLCQRLTKEQDSLSNLRRFGGRSDFQGQDLLFRDL